jgi:pimeloyl-ACP methyl ester carboxylesterase
MRVLFVCGFNPTLTAWNPAYDAVRRHMERAGHDVAWFTYVWAEALDSVYARLEEAMRGAGGLDAVVAHSLGGTLVARYYARHPTALRAEQRVVLCMPLLTHDNAALSALAHVPLVGYVPVPRCVALPALALHGSVVHGGGSVAAEVARGAAAVARGLSAEFLCGAQIVQVYREWIDALDARFVERPNVHVLYASREYLNPIGAATLARAANVRLVAGKHEAYNDAETARGFFDALDACLGAGPRTEKSPIATSPA